MRLILLLFPVIFPALSYGAEIPDREVNPGDISGQMLGSLLGPVWRTVAGGDGGQIRYAMEEAISAITGSLNLCVMALLSFYIIYNFGIAAVTTAHDGRKIGGRYFNSLWMPVRAALSFSMCAPIVQGYSLLQAMIMALAGVGINFADSAWDEARAYIARISPASSISSVTPEAEAKAMIPPLFQGAVALAIGEKAQGQAQSAAKDKSLVNGCLVIRDEKNGAEIIGWPENAGKASGNVTIQLTGNPDLDKARREAVTGLMAGLRKAAQSYVATRNLSPGEPVKSPGFSHLVRAYAVTVGEAMGKHGKKGNGKGNEFVMTAIGGGQKSGLGWISAGLFSYGMAQMIESERALSGNFADFGASPEDLASGGLFSNGRWWMGREQSEAEIRTYVAQAQRAVSEAAGWASGQMDGRQIRSAGSAAWGRYISDIWKSLGGGDVFQDSMSLFVDRDPVQAAAIMGGRLSDTGMNMLAVAADAHLPAAQIAARNPVGGLRTIELGLSLLRSPLYEPLAFLFLWTGQLIRTGAMLLPVAIWIAAYVAWFIALVDTLMAAPFWVLAHASPDGPGFAGSRAAPGYIRLASVVLRPFLMVAGAVLSVAIWRIAGGSLASLLMAATSLSADNSPWDSRLFPAFAIALVFLAIYVWIFMKLVWTMPKTVPLWIGNAVSPSPDASDGGAAGGSSGSGGGMEGRSGGMSALERHNAARRKVNHPKARDSVGQISEN